MNERRFDLKESYGKLVHEIRRNLGLTGEKIREFSIFYGQSYCETESRLTGTYSQAVDKIAGLQLEVGLASPYLET